MHNACGRQKIDQKALIEPNSLSHWAQTPERYSTNSRHGPMLSPCGHGNESLDFIKTVGNIVAN